MLPVGEYRRPDAADRAHGREPQRGQAEREQCRGQDIHPPDWQSRERPVLRDRRARGAAMAQRHELGRPLAARREGHRFLVRTP